MKEVVECADVVASYSAMTVIICLLCGCILWSGLLQLRKEGVVFVLFSFAFIFSAASKSGFRFAEGLRNNGSYSTNSTVYIAWTMTGLVPSNSAVYVEYRKHGDEDAYSPLGQTKAGSLEWRTEALPNATNYDFNIWHSYVPPRPVVTNGIWRYETMKARDGRSVLPLHGVTICDGTILAPPKAKREGESHAPVNSQMRLVRTENNDYAKRNVNERILQRPLGGESSRPQWMSDAQWEVKQIQDKAKDIHTVDATFLPGGIVKEVSE